MAVGDAAPAVAGACDQGADALEADEALGHEEAQAVAWTEVAGVVVELDLG